MNEVLLLHRSKFEVACGILWELWIVIFLLSPQDTECSRWEGPTHPGIDCCGSEEVWLPWGQCRGEWSGLGRWLLWTWKWLFRMVLLKTLLSLKTSFIHDDWILQVDWYFVEVLIISSKLNFTGLFCSILVVKEFYIHLEWWFYIWWIGCPWYGSRKS